MVVRVRLPEEFLIVVESEGAKFSALMVEDFRTEIFVPVQTYCFPRKHVSARKADLSTTSRPVNGT